MLLRGSAIWLAGSFSAEDRRLGAAAERWRLGSPRGMRCRAPAVVLRRWLVVAVVAVGPQRRPQGRDALCLDASMIAESWETADSRLSFTTTCFASRLAAASSFRPRA